MLIADKYSYCFTYIYGFPFIRENGKALVNMGDDIKFNVIVGRKLEIADLTNMRLGFSKRIYTYFFLQKNYA